MPLGMQVVLRLIPESSTFFPEDLALKIFLLPFFLFRCFEKSNCQLMAKECMLSTDKVPLGGLLGNNVVRITDRPDMTSVVYLGRKVINKQKYFAMVIGWLGSLVGLRNAKCVLKFTHRCSSYN